MFLEQLSSSLKWLELPSKLFDPDDARDKLDVCLLKKILVLSLRILDDEADGSGSRVDDGVRERAVRRRTRETKREEKGQGKRVVSNVRKQASNW